MEVNREFWDGETINYTNRSDTIVTTLTDNLWTKIQANPTKYIGQYWDKTICPWKINYNSDLFKMAWVNPYVDMDNQLKTPISTFHKERKKGYTFYLSCNGNINSGQRPGNKSNIVATAPVWLGTLSNLNIDITDTVQSNWLLFKTGDIKPVINFDYSKIYVVPIYHIANGNGRNFTPDLANNFNPTDIYGVSFLFKQINRNSGSNGEAIAMDIISLNNNINKPIWGTTNSWNNDAMFDNTLALQKYTSWDGGLEIGSYQSVGTRYQFGNTYVSGINYPGNGFNDTKLSTDDAAGSVYYIPNKAISISTDDYDDSLWETEYTSFYIGAEYNYGVRRHLKFTTTYEEFFNYVAKQCAYLGFRFLMDYTHDNTDINGEYFYIPEIDEKGVTTGRYYQANTQDAENLPNYNWNTNVYDVTPYDGTDDEEDDSEPYDDNTTVLNPTGDIIHNNFTKRYILDTVKTRNLSTYLYTTVSGELTDISWSAKNFLTNNPIDVIMQLQFFPFDVYRYQTEEVGLQDIYLGVKNSGVQGYICANNVVVVDMGTRKFDSPFGANDFRSYSPYTTAELQIPYCGSIPIEPEIFLGHSINVKYLVDLTTGGCLALIYRDNMVIDSLSGQIGITIPVTGIESQTLASAQQQANAQYKTARNNTVVSSIAGTASVVGGVMTSNPLLIAGGAMALENTLANGAISIQNLQYQLQHMNIPFKSIGVATSSTSYKNEQTPRLIIKRPVMLPDFDAEKYAHTTGYAVLKNDTIGNYSGYTEITGVDLSGIPATEEEKTMIKTLMESGVYL